MAEVLKVVCSGRLLRAFRPVGRLRDSGRGGATRRDAGIHPETPDWTP